MHRLRQLRERSLFMAIVGLGLVQISVFGPSVWQMSGPVTTQRPASPVTATSSPRPAIQEAVVRPLVTSTPVAVAPPVQLPTFSPSPTPSLTPTMPAVISTPKPASANETAATAQRQCDAAMASQFDADVPPGTSPIVDTAVLSDEDVERAIKACEIARKSSDRRFSTELGRAYAARAVRLASSAGHQDEARTAMDKAIAEWKTAEGLGSGAAKNFLGAAFKGTFNTKDFSFFRPDYSVALRYWLDGDAIGNVKATRNAGGLLLLGPSDFPGVPQNLPHARELLTRAINEGDMTAASLYGQALFYNYPKGIALGKNAAGDGVNYLIKACTKGDPSAAEFFTREIAKSPRSPLVPATRPSGC
jgi:hypothetical protein